MNVRIGTKAAGLASALVLAAIAAQSDAHAEQSVYVSAKIGANFLESDAGDFDDGVLFLGAVGFDTGEISDLGKIRLEAEFGYRENEIDGVGEDFEQLSYMANVYHDFLPGWQIRPFLGLGIGAVDSDDGGVGVAEGGTDLAYQGMVGASLQVDSEFSVDAEYRYTGVDADDRLDNHALLVGLRFNF